MLLCQIASFLRHTSKFYKLLPHERFILLQLTVASPEGLHITTDCNSLEREYQEKPKKFISSRLH